MEIKRARAVIIQDNKVLTIHRVKKDREYWCFPGGGIDREDESPEAAVARECMEELGVEVSVKEPICDLLWESPWGDQMERFFRCEILKGEVTVMMGEEMERDVEVSGTFVPEWLDATEIKTSNVLPTEVKEKVQDIIYQDLQ